MIIAGFSAYSRTLDYARFCAIADEVGAVLMADMAHIAGMIAGKALENPFAYGFDVMTFTTHKSLRGPRGGMILVRESEEMFKKINRAVFPGLQGGPIMNLVVAKAVAFGEALDPSFAEYASQVIKNAQAMATVFLDANIRLLGGGTDNHLVLADMTSLGITGKQAEEVLDEIGVTLNKNSIADDSRGPLDPSGIRFGTPAITTRGCGEKECRQVAEWMVDVLRDPKNTDLIKERRERVRELCKQFPIPKKFI